ncbi:MAG: hypothetical protein A3F90_11790 [Deltaproteobacteria bacterium RIFCSPLOWO2_12_FULL_60_19]|nr:MAG: hypothetical protein A3F90_11790 [Deltaproteobacteria bacterium RIFCSPLOWO2_12_FULL_60_19]
MTDKPTCSLSRGMLAGATTLAAVLGIAAIGEAQFDFSNATAAKLRTYPIKRDKGRPAPSKDGMPQAEAVKGGKPANLTEFPAVPVNPNFPGGSILDALQHYQKRDPVAALPAILALLSNGYLEVEIEKPCYTDLVKLQYEHRPTQEVPSVQQAGLTVLAEILADGVAAADLLRAHDRLKESYNNGLSKDRKGDQEKMAALQRLRLGLALRYDPRVETPALAGVPPRQAKERFKAEVAKGKPLEGGFTIGPIQLSVKAKVERTPARPRPPSCK